MRLNYFFPVVNAFVKAGFFRINVPLAVGWNLTFRCNQKCIYCRMWQVQSEELDTQEVLDMVDNFKKLGTRWISFTGGEPLLREDIGEIIRHTKKRGIYVSVSSNGSLVPKRIEDLKGIDRIKLSLDGSKGIHDYIKGEGSFDGTLKAIELCRKNSIFVCLTCVLSKHNLDYIDYLLQIASEHKLKVFFQPATENLLYSKETNSSRPAQERYREAIDRLMELKREGAPIYNSLAGLKHLYYWPVPRKIRCSAGRLSCNVEPDGTILTCNKVFYEVSGKKRETINFEEELAKTLSTRNCMRCWDNSLVEFNLLFSLNPDAVLNYLANEFQQARKQF